MRIWLVNHHALPPSEPGGTRHYSLAREWVRQGHEVTIIASDFNHATGARVRGLEAKRLILSTRYDVPFLFVRVPSYRGHVERLLNVFTFAFWIWSGFATRRLAAPDIIIGSSLTLPAALAAERLARRLRVPFVFEVRDLWPQTLIDMGISKRHPAVIGFGLMERYLYRNAARVVTLLPGCSSYMTTHGATAENITWIPNGVDVSHTAAHRDRGSDERFTVMYTGSHGLTDALDAVLEAAEIVQREMPGRVLFRLIGDGPAKQRLQGLVSERKLGNVMLEPPVSRDVIFDTLQEADVCILTARRTALYRFGISPNKLHEYMAAGRPTIFAAESHNNPIAEAAAGITVAPENARAMADAVMQLARMSTSERRDMGQRARSYAEANHAFPRLAERFMRVLESALVPSDRLLARQVHCGRDIALERVKNAHIS